MTVVLTLTDGTNSVPLINTNTFDLLTGDDKGWLQGDPDQQQIRRSSPFAEGESIVESVSKNVVETFHVALEGSSDNNIAASWQALIALQTSVRDYQRTEWQRTPVYLSRKTADETNTSYALVVDVRWRNDQSLFGQKFDDNTTIDHIIITIEREPGWRPYPPGSVAHNPIAIGSSHAPSNQVSALRQFVNNHTTTGRLTHIFNEDNSAGPAYSSNLYGASLPFDYFKVSGSAIATNDAVYFGSTTGPFFGLVVKIDAEDWATSNVEEYWNGSTWTAGGSLIISHVNFGFDGEQAIRISVTDWARTTVNGVNGYWLRVRINAAVGGAEVSRQVNQDVYGVFSSQITIANTQVKGDVAALARVRFNSYGQIDEAAGWISWIAAGIRSSTVTNFNGHIPLGNAGNPATIAISSLSADTTFVTDVEGASEKIALCTFGSATASVNRLRAAIDSTIVASYVGRFNIYLRCQQIGGSVGDITLNLRYSSTAVTKNLASVFPKTVGEGIEILYLGQLNIRPSVYGRAGNYQNSINSIYLDIIASALSSTPDIRFYSLVLMPADEFAGVYTIPNIEDGGTSLVLRFSNSVLDIDAGLVYPAPIVAISNANSIIGVSEMASLEYQDLWEQRGSLIRIRPDAAAVIVFLVGTLQTSTLAVKAPPSLGGCIEVLIHNQWLLMRGAE